MREVWRDIATYEGLYKVSDQGRIKSLKRVFFSGRYHRNKKTYPERIMKQGLDKGGYCVVSICKEGKKFHLKVYRAVAIAFIPNPENKPEVNHKNGNKLDNRKVNLEWNTKKENIIHAYSIGVKGPGERNGNSILTDEKVRQIRKLHPEFSYYALGKSFKTWPNNIKQIVLRKTWKHVV
jgi:NUMOD4 motif/HNH endonuclease